MNTDNDLAEKDKLVMDVWNLEDEIRFLQSERNMNYSDAIAELKNELKIKNKKLKDLERGENKQREN